VAQVTRPPDVTCALGGDPGGTCGYFLGAWRAQARQPVLVRSFQCGMGSAPELLEWILKAHGHLIQVVSLEGFDARRRSHQLTGISAARMNKLITELASLAVAAEIPAVIRNPGLVKPWADDNRLAAAGLIEVTQGMPRHARDAARHCLHSACRVLGMRDPMSRAAR
jgi:hypothetical protein